MSQSTIYFLISLNVIVIIGLSLYIRTKLRQQKEDQLEAELKRNQFAEEVRKHRLYLIESLQVIGQSIINGEISITEAAIRCKVLLDNLDPLLSQGEHFSVFNELFEETKHIPRLENWKALKGPEKLKYLDEMEVLERGYIERVKQAAEVLVKFDFNRYH